MSSRALKLGTRRSALARAQSAAVAREIALRHPGVRVELVGIDTRGDRILDQPLSTVQGKEFFTAEIDAALLRGEIDLTVHSYKDLALQRDARLQLAAVPPRQLPHDVVIFAADVRARLAAHEPLRIGSSSPRRASFVPAFLEQALPQLTAGRSGRVELVELRGNVDSRLRRLHEPRSSTRQLDGVVLAFAGLARLFADEGTRAALQSLLRGLPRMIVPLSVCPPAPAQGALAIECRRDDPATAQLLAALDDPATREAVDHERALLEARGGGCQQRFGAVYLRLPSLGSLCFSRAAEEQAGAVQLGEPRLDWTPAEPLPAPGAVIRAWDGSRASPAAVVSSDEGIASACRRLPATRALFVAHRRALPEQCAGHVNADAHVWVPGMSTWHALAQRGVWVEGCADGLGVHAIGPLLEAPWLQLPPLSEWLVLTHAQGVEGWPEGSAVATYALGAPAELPPADVTHIWWASATQFAQWQGSGALPGQPISHACGPGKTFEHLRAAGVQNLYVFPQAQTWRAWLQQ
ncbi:MAG TPA: hydroxymethylbilane synthase [Steroidobacteraceae bacterium]|nr:hydroxymethylbilane synthase [Steroidobacteraceae bacterium]